MKILLPSFTCVVVGLLLMQSTAFSPTAHAAEVAFADDGTLRVDGETTLVYGAFRDPSDETLEFGGLKEAGFNLTHLYKFEQMSVKSAEDEAKWIADAREYLQAAHEQGLGVFLGLPRNLVYAGDIERIGRMVEAVRDEPALWFWYTLDEPLLQKKSFKAADREWDEALTAIYEKIKELDQNHPVVVVDSGPRILSSPEEDLQAHRDLCDAIWVDTYAIPYSALAVGRDVAKLQERLPGLAIWAVPEGGAQFPLTQYSFNARYKPGDKRYDPDWTFPKPTFNDRLAALEFTPEAVAAQYFGAWALGSRGVVFYWPPRWSLDMQKHTPGIWQAYVDLGQRIEELHPMLLHAEASDAIRIDHDRWGHLNRMSHLLVEDAQPTREQLSRSPTAVTWAGEYDGSYWAVMVVDYAPVQSFEITLPGPIEKITQYPGGQVVAEASRDEQQLLEIDWDTIGGYVRKIRTDRQALQLILGELDVVIWRIEVASDGSSGGDAPPPTPETQNRPPAVGEGIDPNEM